MLSVRTSPVARQCSVLIAGIVLCTEQILCKKLCMHQHIAEPYSSSLLARVLPDIRIKAYLSDLVSQ